MVLKEKIMKKMNEKKNGIQMKMNYEKENEMQKYGVGQSKNGGCRKDSSFSWRRSVKN